MKKLIIEFFTGRNNNLSGLIAFALVGMIVLGCNCSKETGFSFGDAKVPADAELSALVQYTLQDFAQAIETEDFTNFHANTSSQFQKQFTKEALESAFAVFIQKKEAVVLILNSTVTMQPVYSPAPNVGRESFVQVLDVKGKYETDPVPTNFKLRYLREGDQWKIIEIVIELE